MRYAVSDVHGYRDDLVARLVEVGLVDGDGGWCAGQDDELWVLGDLLDRGPDGVGVVRLVRAWQQQAPEQVRVLMGNHEALAVAMHRFPRGRIAESWAVNGGKRRDQQGLSEDDVDWMAGLPLLAQVGGSLLMHSDTTAYLGWGESIETVNTTVARMLRDGGEAEHWEAWARLTTRFEFHETDGGLAARGMLDAFGGEEIIHGHTLVGVLREIPSAEVTGPWTYADGLVHAIDGGRYDGGPLLVVPLA